MRTTSRATRARGARIFPGGDFFIIASAPKDCLPRSLSLYRFLLMAGVPADHVIGVRRFPFQAHAWVECAGRVVFDSPLANTAGVRYFQAAAALEAWLRFRTRKMLSASSSLEVTIHVP